MNKTQLMRLKELAEKATQEDWNCLYRFDEWENYVGPEEWADIGQSVCICRYEKDASYIAAANPAVVLALIAEIECLRKSNDDLKTRIMRKTQRINGLGDSLEYLRKDYRNLCQILINRNLLITRLEREADQLAKYLADSAVEGNYEDAVAYWREAARKAVAEGHSDEN